MHKGEFAVNSSSFATRYDLAGELLSVEWLSGDLLDVDEQEREYNRSTLDALINTQTADAPISIEILSKITQVGHFEASVRSIRQIAIKFFDWRVVGGKPVIWRRVGWVGS